MAHILNRILYSKENNNRIYKFKNTKTKVNFEDVNDYFNSSIFKINLRLGILKFVKP